jgi:branched-chain amino acid transport system substrate-binding protein
VLLGSSFKLKADQEMQARFQHFRCVLSCASTIFAMFYLVSAHAEILIATAGPFTGTNIFRGEQIQQGAEMAVADINASGGVLGERVELLIADDACDPEQAAAVANKLVSAGVVFVAGHVCSHSSIPASRVYQSAGVLMISPASTNPRLTDEGGDNIFRVCGRDDHQGVVAGNYLSDIWRDQNIAIIHDGSTYGEGLANATRRQLEKRGVVTALEETYTPGERDYSQLVDKMQAASIDVIYVGGYTAETGLMVRQARDRDYSAQFVSGDALTNEEFWLITGQAGEGTLGTFGPDPRSYQAAASVVTRFRDKGFEPSGYTLHTYAAVQAWAQATQKAGTLAADKVIESLRHEQFDTVLGKISFDDKGDVSAPGYIWYMWKSGKYVPVP